MMGVGGLASAHQTGLGRDKLPMAFVAQSARFGRDSVVLEIRRLVAGGQDLLQYSSDGEALAGQRVSL